MQLEIYAHSCSKNEIMPLTCNNKIKNAHRLIKEDSLVFFPLPAGAFLSVCSSPVFLVCGYKWIELDGCFFQYPLLKALRNINEESLCLEVIKNGWSAAVITLSDKGSTGKRTDESGPAILELLKTRLEISFYKRYILADDLAKLRALAAEKALVDRYDLIIATGGTGAGPRDITPQAVSPLIDFMLPGFSYAMLMTSLQKTPNAIISRCFAGIIEKSLFIALPGSVRAVKENLAAVLPAMEHTLKKIHGDSTDCGSQTRTP